jgi:hypothetical protein
MRSSKFESRRAATIENEFLRVTVLVEGGHIAEVLDKATGINPLWTPPWPSIEPSTYDPAAHAGVYGRGTDARLLAGIAGHNLCLDIFGGPSEEEAAAGLTAHGDAPVIGYEIETGDKDLVMRAVLPRAHIGFERRIELGERVLSIQERIDSLLAIDRPLAWTEHVTLGPPFLEKGRTEFRLSATRSQVIDAVFGAADYLRRGATFDWPMAPRGDGGLADLRLFTAEPQSSAYTAHLMNPALDTASFVAFSPSARLVFGYVWRRADFPWLGIWEENYSRSGPPWNGAALTRGMEFGVSPFPETRRDMVGRGRLFDTATWRWLPANGRLEARYRVIIQHADRIPESISW